MTQTKAPLTIDERVHERIDGLEVVVANVTVQNPDEVAIAAFLDQSWQSLAAETAESNPKQLPRIAAWRSALSRAGISLKKCPPSIEAIAARTKKATAPFSINPVVDTYNALSMSLVLPFGAYDVADLDEGLQLRISDGGEVFEELGSLKRSETVAGEIVYADASTILTRHLLWRQSEKAKIRPDTRRFVLVCELLEVMEPGLQQQVLDAVTQSFSRLFEAEFHWIGTVT